MMICHGVRVDKTSWWSDSDPGVIQACTRSRANDLIEPNTTEDSDAARKLAGSLVKTESFCSERRTMPGQRLRSHTEVVG